MGEPSEQIAGGIAGCGCLTAVVIFFVALFSGAGFLGAVGITLVILFLAAWAVGTLS